MDKLDINAALGAVIRARRQRLNMTQEALAKRVGISMDFLKAIERGDRGMSLSTFISFLQALDLSPNDMLQPILHAPAPKQKTYQLKSVIAELGLEIRIYRVYEKEADG